MQSNYNLLYALLCSYTLSLAVCLFRGLIICSETLQHMVGNFQAFT